jgi:ABC-type transport system involved in cytochrome c biogenesis permease subunit
MLRVTVFCFLASYLVVLGLELGRLLGKSRVSRFVMIGFGLAGFLAHTLYLLNRSQETHLPPLLASTHDWTLVLAWLLILFYLVVALVQKDLAIGVFLLPVVLLLVTSAYFLNHEPNTALNAERARRHWMMLHASFLVFGLAAGAGGFLSGLMYLIQHRRLKTRHGEISGLKMPSLARLALVNRWSVLVAFLMLTLGFGIGVVRAVVPPDGASAVGLTDPAVVTSGVVWLILAVVFFRLLSHRGSTGTQVAWLTLCACGLVLLVFVGLQVITGGVHSYSHSVSARGAPD